MRIEYEVKLDFKDVLIRPKRSNLKSRSQVTLDRTYRFLHSKREWTGVPVVAANMDTTGTLEMAEELAKHKMLVALHKHYTADELVEWCGKHAEAVPFVMASSGTSDRDFEKICDVLKRTEISFLCLDVANGYSEHFVEYVKKVRAAFPSITLAAGNVVTGEMVEELVLAGADIVKIGIGSGASCLTRRMAGVGMPQLSAVIECADAAHGLGALVMSDGGCKTPSDLAKAFGGGADFVMLGGMLAGHDESGGDLVERDGKQFKEFYGMSSAVAMKKHAGSVAEYRSSEGRHVLLPYRGPVRTTVLDILGGIRSACTYTGAWTLKELSKRTTFLRVTQQLNEVYASVTTGKGAGRNA